MNVFGGLMLSGHKFVERIVKARAAKSRARMFAPNRALQKKGAERRVGSAFRL
jgi:hypothetical protein